ncbi:endolytic transglycosylase MltG [Paenibacillus sp. 1001270B_150601_E10]|uniref:endolytic transglycosylase MltG n=1 Tax=Paenibacillus sp. 1001270B_150601_E10 TaxID=2787079 RepID=UPI00189CBD45|nr:endolytic transglycosylase MltG [Paenibacillus sp. 1001270B_150601_E10]
MRTAAKAALAFLIVIIIIIGAGAWYVWNGMQPVQGQDKPIEVSIEEGTGTSAIAQHLEEQGVIKNALLFKLYLKMNNEGSAFMAGKYSFDPSSTYEQIIKKLNAGDVIPVETVRVMVPEGYTIEQIADDLSEKGIVEREAFIQAADKIGKEKPSDLTLNLPKPNDKLKHVLEGYLFPETYEFAVGTSAEEMIVRMLKETEKRLIDIPNFDAKLEQSGMTLQELLTVASLVEREVVVDEERPLVAGVIYNRLNKPMRLQIDATIQYALDKPKERLYYKDLEIESPYNTYKEDGLPPGPIASPSLESIKAALEPETSDYFYYVTKKDGTQTHLFAKTYEEHLSNIEKSKQ